MESAMREEIAALRHMHALTEMRFETLLVEVLLGEMKKYNANQPRVPAGSSDGGQWTDGGGGGKPANKPKPSLSRPKISVSKPSLVNGTTLYGLVTKYSMQIIM